MLYSKTKIDEVYAIYSYILHKNQNTYKININLNWSVETACRIDTPTLTQQHTDKPTYPQRSARSTTNTRLHKAGLLEV